MPKILYLAIFLILVACAAEEPEGGYDIGMDQGSPVTNEYKPPFEFSGTINKVIFDVSGS
jgi:hypothetical protein